MKERLTEQLIAIFFKGLSMLAVLAGGGSWLLQMERIGGDDSKYIFGWVMVLGVAPVSWWMGEVISILSRIARNGERAESVPRAAPAPVSRKTTVPAAESCTKPLLRPMQGDQHGGTVPEYKL